MTQPTLRVIQGGLRDREPKGAGRPLGMTGPQCNLCGLPIRYDFGNDRWDHINPHHDKFHRAVAQVEP